MADDIKTTGIPQKKLRSLLEKTREKIKDHEVIADLFKEYDIPLSEIEYIPMCFADIAVSARTDHGCIYFNTNLLNDPEQLDHYMVHEICHWAQQTTGNKPTQGAEDGDYLENPYEVEGFQTQVEYIADTQDEGAAEDYVDQVLEHHDDDSNTEKKEELLKKINSRISALLTFGV